jgi:hypothetical protein
MKTSNERQKKFRQKNKQLGLLRKEYIALPSHHLLLAQYLSELKTTIDNNKLI